MKLAVTGATGFVGRRLLRLAEERGLRLKALTRRPQPPHPALDWVEGALDDYPSLATLCKDCDAVIHIAGVIKAPDREGFMRGNAEGTSALLAAAEEARVPHFVHVSSLAAREPELSLYGLSKKAAEDRVSDAAISSVIVRPPAVYGPGDRETLELFKMARRGLVLMPPEGRASYIHADDLAALLLDLATRRALTGRIVEPDDNKEGGWSHREFARQLGTAVGRKPLVLNMPAGALKAGAAIDGLLRRSAAKLTPDRAAYFCHPDWTVSPDLRPDAKFWSPAIETPAGLEQTARWYRDHGWL